MHLFAPLAAALAAAAPTTVAAPMTVAATLDSPTRHVRAAAPDVTSLIRQGVERSPTFADLLSRLEQSDVIVHIELVPSLSSNLEGRMMLLAQTPNHRYVRIQVTRRASHFDTIALIGHELRHAVEIADAREVGRGDQVMDLYRRIGTLSGWHQYETVAAQDAGRRIRRELV